HGRTDKWNEHEHHHHPRVPAGSPIIAAPQWPYAAWATCRATTSSTSPLRSDTRRRTGSSGSSDRLRGTPSATPVLESVTAPAVSASHTATSIHCGETSTGADNCGGPNRPARYSRRHFVSWLV